MMKTGFFYAEEERAVVLEDKKALLAEVDEAIGKAPADPETKPFYEAYVSTHRRSGYGTVFVPEELGKKHAKAIAGRDKFALGSDEYARLDSKVSGLQKAIENAIGATEEESVSVSSREVPARSVEFRTGGCRMRIYESKEVLSAFRKRVRRTPATCVLIVRLKPKKHAAPEPVAAGAEAIDDLVKVNRKGWFTDGHLMIKGEAPKEMAVPTGKGYDASGIMADAAYGNTEPAKLLYYGLKGLDEMAVSKSPVLRLGQGHVFVLFKVGDKYVSYGQGKFNAVRNRYPGAEYRICMGSGMVVAYKGQKAVAVLMPACFGHSDDRISLTPLLEGEAIEAGFLKRPALN